LPEKKRHAELWLGVGGGGLEVRLVVGWDREKAGKGKCRLMTAMNHDAE
jgi:hypothetical protein